LYFNVVSLRDMAFDALRDVPLIGGVIPDGGDREPRLSAAELQSGNDLLRRQVESLVRERDDLRADLENARRDIERLSGFGEEQDRFKRAQEAFVDGLIAGDPQGFWRLFQQMDPGLAERHYRDAAGTAAAAQEVRDFLIMMREMDEKSTAAALEILMDTNAALVVSILKSLNNDTAAAILERIEVEKRAALIRMLAPPDL